MEATDQSPILLTYRILDEPVVIAVPQLDAATAVAAMLRGFGRLDPPRMPAVKRDHGPVRRETRDPAPYQLVRGERGGWTVDARGTRAYQDVSLAEAVVGLEWHLVFDALKSTGDRLHLHGAALCEPSGAASVLILGASGSGKTTLALALMGRGFLPITDDVIVIDPETLSPRTFGRAFHVDALTRALVAGLKHPPACDDDGLPPGHLLPGRWAEGHAPVRAIYFPTLNPGGAPSATRLSISQAAARLLPFSATLGSAPRLALRMASRLTASASCYALASGDLEATADLVSAEIARMIRDDHAAT